MIIKKHKGKIYYYAKVLLPPITRSGKNYRGKFGIIRVPMNWVGKRVKISFKNKSLSKEMKELIRNANNNHNG